MALSCGQCRVAFDVVQRRPKVLPCGHTVCVICLVEHAKGSRRMCPFCRKVFKVELEQIADSIVVMNLLRNNADSGRSLLRGPQALQQRQQRGRLAEAVAGPSTSSSSSSLWLTAADQRRVGRLAEDVRLEGEVLVKEEAVASGEQQQHLQQQQQQFQQQQQQQFQQQQQQQFQQQQQQQQFQQQQQQQRWGGEGPSRSLLQAALSSARQHLQHALPVLRQEGGRLPTPAVPVTVKEEEVVAVQDDNEDVDEGPPLSPSSGLELLQLPDDALVALLQCMAVEDLLLCRRVCRRLYVLAGLPAVWQHRRLHDRDPASRTAMRAALRFAPRVDWLSVTTAAGGALQRFPALLGTARCAATSLSVHLDGDHIIVDRVAHSVGTATLNAAVAVRRQAELGRLRDLKLDLELESRRTFANALPATITRPLVTLLVTAMQVDGLQFLWVMYSRQLYDLLAAADRPDAQGRRNLCLPAKLLQSPPSLEHLVYGTGPHRVGKADSVLRSLLARHAATLQSVELVGLLECEPCVMKALAGMSALRTVGVPVVEGVSRLLACPRLANLTLELVHGNYATEAGAYALAEAEILVSKAGHGYGLRYPGQVRGHGLTCLTVMYGYGLYGGLRFSQRPESRLVRALAPVGHSVERESDRDVLQLTTLQAYGCPKARPYSDVMDGPYGFGTYRTFVTRMGPFPSD